MIGSHRSLGPEQTTVLERISWDLDRDVLLAEALGQHRLASEIRATLALTREIIALGSSRWGETQMDLEKKIGAEQSDASSKIAEHGEHHIEHEEPFVASLLYLASDIESISPAAAQLCRTAAELVDLTHQRNNPAAAEAGPAGSCGQSTSERAAG